MTGRNVRRWLSPSLVISGLGLLPVLGGAQDQPRQWERRLEATEPPMTVFSSTQAIALPTAATLGGGEWLFEIAHRFFPPVADGVDALWGLDGPVNMRLGLGFAPADRVLVTLARSNLMDNWDLQAKFRALAAEIGPLPVMVSFQGGAAWSTDVPEREASDSGNFQYYGQIILNAGLAERVAVGVVPSYLYNAFLDESDPEHRLYWGFYGQLRVTPILSLLGELNLGDNPEDLEHDSYALGIELETGGHFFKIFLGNSLRSNPSQYLVGTEFPFHADELRLGFAITRLLRF